MTTEQISQDLMTFLREEFPGQGNELTEEMNLLDDWFLDSLSIVDVVMFLESHFDIAVDRKDITGDNFHSVVALTRYVEQQING